MWPNPQFPADLVTFTEDTPLKRLDTLNVCAQLLKQNATDKNNIDGEAIIQTRKSCKKISCFLYSSAYWWRIVENARIFWSCIKYFWFLPLVRKTEYWLVWKHCGIKVLYIWWWSFENGANPLMINVLKCLDIL